MQGMEQFANQFASPYFDLGGVGRTRDSTEWSGMEPYINDLDLGTCSTDFVDPDGDGIGVVLEEIRCR